MKQLKFISVQPRITYYTWQLEVMLNNFLKHEINPANIFVLVAYSPDQNDRTNNSEIVELYNKLIAKFNRVKFYFYKDTRQSPSYISSVRPNILKQHFTNFPELKNDAIFYHDCDIVFTKKPELDKFTNDDISYLSDTISYIGSRYILSKGEDIYNRICDIIGIDKKIPKIMESNSGGAQYLLKNIDAQFWEKVEKDCEIMYRYFLEDEPRKLAYNPKYHPIQKWTADMWSLLFNLWYYEHETKVIPELDFTWATDTIEKWDKNFIYHNAGVVDDKHEMFYKGKYINTLPYFIIDEIFNPKYASYNYYKEIIDTGKNSCLISEMKIMEGPII